MKVIIDPRSSYAYGSMYVYGLMRIGATISYSMAPFRYLHSLENNLRFVVQKDDIQTKYFIHANDSYHIIREDYEWCDVYGCVNANFTHYPKEKCPKLVSLVPSFGISLYDKWGTMWLALRNLIKCPRAVLCKTAWNKYKNRMEVNIYRNCKHYFGSEHYKIWLNRLPYESYNNTVVSKDDYIFFLSTVWYSNEENKNDEGVNLRRTHFIRACKSVPDCHFEGGLLGDKSSSNEKFADVVTMQPVAFPDWIEKTKRSALVFNTPAFWDCHGWKLGEYLALGKCIVSTKLSKICLTHWSME